METDTTQSQEIKQKPSPVRGAILLAVLFLGGVWLYKVRPPEWKNALGESRTPAAQLTAAELEEIVLPQEGVLLPVTWNDLGLAMARDGVVDVEKFEALYSNRGGMSPEIRRLLSERTTEPLRMTEENAGYLLNLFWALGLGIKNPVLEKGPMSDPQYGGAERFASTAGWTLARGDAMDHFSRHPYLELTTEQQELVERITKNIYRPCCGNSTYFPDCNHGMAMLGLVELMAAQGIGERDIYRVALQVNAFWFPDTYLTIAQYLAMQGKAWSAADPKEILGKEFSSGAGYQRILAEVKPPQSGGGGSCGV